MEELVERVASFKVIEERRDRNPRTDEHGCAAEDVRITVDDFQIRSHGSHPLSAESIAPLWLVVGLTTPSCGNVGTGMPRAIGWWERVAPSAAKAATSN